MKKSVKRVLSGFLAVLFALVTCFGNAGLTFAAEATRKIDVWDFGGVQETDTTIYNNNITGKMWDDCALVGSNAQFSTGKVTFGDLELTAEGKDRLFSGFSTKNYGTNSYATKTYSDGYTANGMYYCNGTGGAARRLFTISNVKAGDKIVAYMASSNAAESKIYFKYAGSDKEYQAALDFSNTEGIKEFVAPFDGTYVIYTDGSAGKPIYNRIVRIPAVKVSGTIDMGGATATGFTLNFTNDNSGEVVAATVSGTSFTANLAAGETYTASLSGVTGIGFTNASKVVTTTKAEALSGKTVKLVVEAKSVYKYTGKVTGFASNYDISKLKVTLAAPEGSLSDDVVLAIDSSLNFTATLEPDVEYTVVLSGVNDYEVVAGGTVCDNQNYSADIKVATKAVYAVSGSFFGNGTAKVTALSFENVEDGYKYVATVSGNTYSANLRNGAYLAVATVDGYKTSTHVVVEDGAVSKDLMFVSTTKAEAMTLVSDIYVGYPDKGALNYATVKEAVAACAAMNPTKESERITVHIAPGTYREQIIITTPFISFVNDTDKQVLLTWYYGIGYKYYSADASGFYNPENAYDQVYKAIASKWGVSTYVKSTATDFKAKGITFEASFNRYVTDEEIVDGVEVSGTEKININRNYSTDVTTKAATERAAAFAIEAVNGEFVDCTFLSSQDTLFTGKGTCPYFKNCHIEGNTDYIFGEGNGVFDGCELMWYGYSDQLVSGYITAHRPADSATLGYIFRNCTVTANPKMQVKPGYFGRPWGADAKVTLINTQLTGDLIDATGWYEMSGNNPANANFVEYNTTRTDGTAVDTSKRVKAAVTTKPSTAVKNFLGSFVPTSLATEDTTVAFATKPYVVDNGDINAPYPGHTLTVAYSLGNAQANDASTINWYIVGETAETLVKSTTAYVDNTYVIGKEAIGKKIKVTVTPKTISGASAAAVSYTVDATVKDGFEDPTGSIDIDLGDGINIFLAGDSTVKDYSANGMYMSGKPQNEGSWGEFLQGFFDSSKVKVINYANGGRSTRNFINEGSLDKIAANIKEGDYLFIQFGHNDCSNASGYLEDRYVPLGTPDANGIYPVTAGKEVATPSSLTSKYGDTFYSYDCGGTYKWYLLQYIEVARKAGAIPVLVTPVSRLYFTSDGTIKTHHDSTDTTTNTQVTSGDAYVQAVLQLAQEEKVAVIDAFALTKNMYEEAYKAAGNDTLAFQLMAAGDKTHSNKVGGFISATYVAEAIQDLEVSVSKYVKMPEKVVGVTTKGTETVFVNSKSEATISIPNSDGTTAEYSKHWTEYAQARIGAIGAKNEALNAKPDAPVEKKNGLCDDGNGNVYYYVDDVVDTTYTTAVNYNGAWRYVLNGKLEATYTGIVAYNGTNWYFKNGYIDNKTTGLVYSNNAWYYVSNGKQNKTFVGIAEANGSKWYVKDGTISRASGYATIGSDIYAIKDGKVNTATTDLLYVNGKWYYFRAGVVDWTYTSLAYANETWWYVKEGQLDKTFTGLTPFRNQMWYVKEGKLDKTFAGIVNCDGTIYDVKNGIGTKRAGYTGLIYVDGGWSYLTNGVVDKEYRGVATANGSIWFVENGTLSSRNGVWTQDGEIYWIVNGKVDSSVYDLKYTNGKWYYFRAGIVDWTYNDLAYANNAWWYVKNGELDKTYTGLYLFRSQLWYINAGKLDKTYTGTVTYEGESYTVSNGVGKLAK